MIGDYRIHGYAAVSDEGCIATANGAIPPDLRNAMDSAGFQAAMEAAAVTVLSARVHASFPPSANERDRLVASPRATGIEHHDGAWWWNPRQATIAEGLRRAAPDGGVVIVRGGVKLFDAFLSPGFDEFHLVRARGVRIPGGIRVFSMVGRGRSPETVLAGNRMRPGPIETIDVEKGVSLMVWRTVGMQQMSREPAEILKSTPFFADVLSASEVEMLAARARFISYAPGATPIEEDGPGQSMFVIVSGRVSVTIGGESEPVATLGPGDIFGEMSLLTGARRSATVTGLEPVEVIEVNKQALAHVLEHSPTLVGRFVEMLARRQRQLDRLAGGVAWGMLRPGRAELAHMIGSFFGKVM